MSCLHNKGFLPSNFLKAWLALFGHRIGDCLTAQILTDNFYSGSLIDEDLLTADIFIKRTPLKNRQVFSSSWSFLCISKPPERGQLKVEIGSTFTIAAVKFQYDSLLSSTTTQSCEFWESCVVEPWRSGMGMGTWGAHGECLRFG